MYVVSVDLYPSANRMTMALCRTLLIACVLNATSAVARGQSTAGPRACPTASEKTWDWVFARQQAAGFELAHPIGYREKNWESRSDSSVVSFALWRDAVTTVEFHQLRAPLNENDLPGITCELSTRSGSLPMRLERSTRKLYTGRDTVEFLGRGVFSTHTKMRMLVQIAAPDSMGMLEQLAILRTLHFP